MADQQALHAFAQWVAGCSGNEKQEGQTFVQKLLTAWGWKDATEAGACFEHKIPKGGAGGGMGYADALIPGQVLIEMKQRGVGLGQHFPQLQRYWFNLAPKPTYAILCNFDEFWVYDFNIQVDEPVEQLKTAQLAERWSGLAFLSKAPETPLFGNNQISVTEKQAQAMGHLFHDLKVQAAKTEQFSAQQAQRFVLQCVLCMFAEDRGMLPNRQFILALEGCREKGDSTYDVLGGLFAAMNTPGETLGGRFKGTPYFNGGLFSEIPQIELSPDQLTLLVESAREDWRMVRPSIFGNIFEASSTDARRHALGQHFTSEADILKVVRPTIIEPWEARIDSAKTIGELDALLADIQQYRVLDPACGSGNFLYLAYNGLKDIEADIIRRIRERRKSDYLKGQGALGYVNTNQFFGMDTDPFAVELARVTLMIARKVAHDRLGLTEQELPLDNLDKNIVQADALFTPWPEADAIIGNPPFVAVKNKRLELGDDYVEKLFSAYPAHRDTDLCSPWFTIAHANLKEDGRAGLVATNSICQGKNRRATLDYIFSNGGHISNAISSQPWSGDAKVFVSIINWSKKKPISYTLDGQDVPVINSALTAEIDVFQAVSLRANRGYSFVGVQPNSKNFYVSPETGMQWIREDPIYLDVVRPFTTADDLTDSPLGHSARWIIDFSDRAIEEAELYPRAFAQARALVKPERERNREKVLREKWWRFKRTNSDLRAALARAESFICFPRHSKWVIPLLINKRALPGDSTTVVAADDFYLLGVTTSSIHRTWVLSQKSTIKGDTRYTHTTCFNTFPFPQQVTALQAEAIRQQMIELNNYRNTWMVENEKGITELYNRYFHEPASQLAKLHQALDVLVLKAYGWKANEDILSNLLNLNLELAKREAAGEKLVGPWAPT